MALPLEETIETERVVRAQELEREKLIELCSSLPPIIILSKMDRRQLLSIIPDSRRSRFLTRKTEYIRYYLEEKYSTREMLKHLPTYQIQQLSQIALQPLS